MTMLSTNGCLLVLGISIASLASGQPMSLNEPLQPRRLSCNFLTCTGAILGAVETCLKTGSAEEVIDCVKNILESIGKGDCKACICHIIPHFCHDKEKERASLVKMAKQPSQCLPWQKLCPPSQKCCPAHWYCCRNYDCAATADQCPGREGLTGEDPFLV